MRCAVTIAAAATIAFGQVAGRGVISGTVIEATSGEPVRKAIVTLTLEGEPKRWATTRRDGSGQFSFVGLPAGKYDLRARKQGLGAATYGATGAGQIGEIISLKEREARVGVNLLFNRFGWIAGRVFDTDGEPVPSTAITLFRTDPNMGYLVMTRYAGGTTDNRGNFRLEGLVPGDYYLFASPPRAPANGQRKGNSLFL